MIEQLLLDHCWLPIVIWAAVYISDYYLTLYAARLYRAGVDQKYVYEGSFELTPYYQRDIDRLCGLSPRFLVMLCSSSLVIGLFWLFYADQWKQMFLFFYGALLLIEVPIHFRHIHNIMTLRYAHHPDWIQGRIEYPRWIIYRISAIELLSFAVFFLFIFVMTGHWFFLGGMATGLSSSYKHWRMSGKFLPNEALEPDDMQPESEVEAEGSYTE